MTEALPVGISYSLGASSRHLIELIINGEVPRPKNVAVFTADTGDEHEWSYEDGERVEERCKAAGIPFFRGSHREPLVDAVLSATRGERTRVDNPPFWTENPGGSRGQLDQRCSVLFKTAVIRRMQSAWLKSLGLPKQLSCWLGFGNDEQHRANKAVGRNDVAWQRLDFPAIRLGKNRGAQRADFDRWGLKAPLFSMCKRCPFKNPQRWAQTTKADLEGVYEYDEAIRHGLEHTEVHETVYLTDRLIPVEQLIKKGDPQPSLPGFEIPGCDSGACFL